MCRRRNRLIRYFILLSEKGFLAVCWRRRMYCLWRVPTILSPFTARSSSLTAGPAKAAPIRPSITTSHPDDPP